MEHAVAGRGRVYDEREHRMTIEALLYRMLTGCPWCERPSDPGRWNAVFRRFKWWSRKGVIEELFRSP